MDPGYDRYLIQSGSTAVMRVVPRALLSRPFRGTGLIFWRCKAVSKKDDKYAATLNLPETEFPMRAGLPKREPEMLQEMYDHDLYHKMVKRNEGKPTFVLHDGPPYANCNIHIGTALNKILKDITIKSRIIQGQQSVYVPGWDCHGLPNE